MNTANPWFKAKEVSIRLSGGMTPGFDIGFDKKIPQQTQDELRAFVNWVEHNFPMPVPLWVDFAYRHYLIDKNGKRVGYLFYWNDFSGYPVFENPADIPMIRLPVRTERSTMEEILLSFIEAIGDYFLWVCNEFDGENSIGAGDAEEILQLYLNTRT